MLHNYSTNCVHEHSHVCETTHVCERTGKLPYIFTQFVLQDGVYSVPHMNIHYTFLCICDTSMCLLLITLFISLEISKSLCLYSCGVYSDSGSGQILSASMPTITYLSASTFLVLHDNLIKTTHMLKLSQLANIF